MTNHWVDMKNANLIIVMGSNAAEAHPVGFCWAMEAKIHNNAKLIVIDPRFTRTALVADFYTLVRSGTDIVFLSGVLRYLMTSNKINRKYIEDYTNASLLVREDFTFEDGLFSGYDAENRMYHKTICNYQFGQNGYAKRDVTLQNARCVWNPLKAHVSRLYARCSRKHLRYVRHRMISCRYVNLSLKPVRMIRRPYSRMRWAGLTNWWGAER